VVGETVTISANVTNAGGAEGSRDVVLKKNGVMEATSEVTLAPGQSTTVSFSSTADCAGNYQMEIDGLTGEFTVIEAAPVNAWFIAGPILAVILAGSVTYYFVRIRKRKGSSQTT